jgi:hypothetical protein
MLRAGSMPGVPNNSAVSLTWTQLGSSKELESVSFGIRALVELDSLLGNFGWHPRRTVSKLNKPCWKNLP